MLTRLSFPGCLPCVWFLVLIGGVAMAGFGTPSYSQVKVQAALEGQHDHHGQPS